MQRPASAGPQQLQRRASSAATLGGMGSSKGGIALGGMGSSSGGIGASAAPNRAKAIYGRPAENAQRRATALHLAQVRPILPRSYPAPILSRLDLILPRSHPAPSRWLYPVLLDPVPHLPHPTFSPTPPPSCVYSCSSKARCTSPLTRIHPRSLLAFGRSRPHLRRTAGIRGHRAAWDPIVRVRPCAAPHASQLLLEESTGVGHSSTNPCTNHVHDERYDISPLTMRTVFHMVMSHERLLHVETADERSLRTRCPLAGGGALSKCNTTVVNSLSITNVRA